MSCPEAHGCPVARVVSSLQSLLKVRGGLLSKAEKNDECLAEKTGVSTQASPRATGEGGESMASGRGNMNQLTASPRGLESRREGEAAGRAVRVYWGWRRQDKTAAALDEDKREPNGRRWRDCRGNGAGPETNRHGWRARRVRGCAILHGVTCGYTRKVARGEVLWDGASQKRERAPAGMTAWMGPATAS